MSRCECEPQEEEGGVPVVQRYPERPARPPAPQGELQVVIVLEMSADEFPGEIAEGYAAACAALGVPASAAGMA